MEFYDDISMLVLKEERLDFFLFIMRVIFFCEIREKGKVFYVNSLGFFGSVVVWLVLFEIIMLGALMMLRRFCFWVWVCKFVF